MYKTMFQKCNKESKQLKMLFVLGYINQNIRLYQKHDY